MILSVKFNELNKLFSSEWSGGMVKPLEHAISKMEYNKFMVSCEMNTHNRAFCSFDSAFTFLDTYEKLDKTQLKNYYEVILTDKRRRMYFDLDFKIADTSDSEMIKLFVEHIKTIPHFNNTKMKILSASDDIKGSLHFIINNKILRNKKETKELFNIVVNNDICDTLRNAIDDKVYSNNQQFRMIGSCKYGSTRVLQPIGIDGKTYRALYYEKYMVTYIMVNGFNTPMKPYYFNEIVEPNSIVKINEVVCQEDTNVKKAIELYSTFDDSINHNLHNNKIEQFEDGNIKISFTRSNSSYCDICKKTHDNDNTAYLVIINNTNVFIKCYKSTGVTFVGKINEGVPAISNNEDEKNQDTFIQSAIKSVIKKTIIKLEQKIENDFKKLGCEVVRYSNKFCSENEELINSQSSIIGQRASMGTGKTNAAAIRALKYGENDRIIVASFRLALTSQLKNDKFAQDVNMASYTDLKGKITANHFIIQPESMHRIGLIKGNREFFIDEIFIDEANQVKKQFTSDTFLKNPNANRSAKMFEYIIKNTKHIHLMDANLTADTIKWIADIKAGGDCNNKVSCKTTIYWNNHKNLKDRELIIAKSEIDIIRLAKADLAENKKIFIASNAGVDKIKAIAELLKSNEKNVLCVCSDTLGNKEVKKALSNPNEEFDKFDVIICSPSIQSGISYDIPNRFDQVYGMFSDCTSAAEDCAQMINRIRHPKSNKTYVSITCINNNIGPTTKVGMINYYKYNRDHINLAIQERVRMLENVCDYNISDYGENEFKKTHMFNLIVENMADKNKDLKGFIWNFIRSHHIEGYNITAFDANEHFKMDDAANKASNKEIKNLIKLIKNKNKADDAADISKAKNETEARLEAIRNNLNSNVEVAKEDTDALKKYNITKQYDVDIQQSPEWMLVYGDKQVRKIFHNQNKLLKHDTFQEALNEIKMIEIKKTNDIVDEHLGPDTLLHLDEALDKAAINYTQFKPKYEKYKLLFDWITKVGYNSIDTSETVIKENIQKSLQEIHRDVMRDTEHIMRTLDKDKKKIAAIKAWKYDNPRFCSNMLKFINGSLSNELGITIGPIKRRSLDYALLNKYLDVKHTPHFNNVRHNTNKIIDHSIPNIGMKTRAIRDYVPTDEPYDSDDDNEDE